MWTVFVGSSSESKKRGSLSAAQQGLATQLYPILWDTPRAFPSGHYTLDRLVDLTDDVDCAVILWDADDTTWYRGAETKTTRDNCVLEYGLFVSKLGSARVGLLVREGVRVPTDLLGLTTLSYNDLNLERQAQELAQQLRTTLDQPGRRRTIPIVVQEHLLDLLSSRPQIKANWGTRALYCRDTGATYWLQLCADPAYALSPLGGDPFHHTQAVRNVLQQIRRNGIEVRRLVTLGIGDGTAEKRILRELDDTRSIEVVAVDISLGLLNHSLGQLKSGYNVRLGLNADFEEPEGAAFIGEQLNEIGERSVTMFCLVGNTFGNLDLGERNFIRMLRGLMRDDDLLLFDTSVQGQAWSPSKDARMKPSEEKEPYKGFIASALSWLTAHPFDEVRKNFNDRIEASVDNGRSDVEDTPTITITDKDTSRELLRFRRYDENRLSLWLQGQENLTMVASAVSDQERADLRMGVFLLKKQ